MTHTLDRWEMIDKPVRTGFIGIPGEGGLASRRLHKNQSKHLDKESLAIQHPKTGGGRVNG